MEPDNILFKVDMLEEVILVVIYIQNTVILMRKYYETK